MLMYNESSIPIINKLTDKWSPQIKSLSLQVCFSFARPFVARLAGANSTKELLEQNNKSKGKAIQLLTSMRLVYNIDGGDDWQEQMAT